MPRAATGLDGRGRSEQNGLMRKRSSNKPVEPPPAPVQEAESPPPPPSPAAEKNPAAVALGRLGGAKGGPARAKELSKEQRSEIAKKAAAARWKRRDA